MIKVRTGLEDWIKENPDRDQPPQKDYGFEWTFQGQQLPRWHVVWIENTGELYAEERTDPLNKFILHSKRFKTKDEADKHMEGWLDNPLGKPLEPYFKEKPKGMLREGGTVGMLGG